MEGKVEYVARTKDGVVVRIYKEKGLHRAFSAPGKQVGLPFVTLTNLLKDINAELIPAGVETEPAGVETDPAGERSL